MDTDRRKLSKKKLNQEDHGESDSQRPFAKRRVHVPLVLVMLLLEMVWPVYLPANGTLLTNLYSKKLSEMTDYANRYLIIPSSALSPAEPHPQQQQQQQQQPQQQHEQPHEQLQSETQASPLAQAWSRSGTMGLPMAQTSPLAAKRTGAKQRAQEANLSSIDNSLVPDEPVVVEGISTEFPNPNINNLGHEITKILKKFFLFGYDKRVRPNYSGPPALVNVSFHIIGISSVDEVQMDFTTDFYFRQKWYDPRLVFEPVNGVDELCVGAEFAEKIWLPDTFFANEKTATFHKATTDNTFIRIGNTGRVYRSIRLTVTCSCPMDLQYFPMDRQRCKIEIESYGYNTRDIDYRWERGDQSVTLNTKIELPQFKILGFKMGQEVQNLSSGDYIRLYCEIHFVRSMGYYLIQIYIPASLIVMISWVSFWLHRNATPARVALGVTTVLTMTTLMSSTNAALPKISYIKSIDVFLGTCFVMVFASLLEYASVGYIGKRIVMKQKRLQELQQMQRHHQKVCVAAAASAAAAAAAVARGSNAHLDSHLNNNHNHTNFMLSDPYATVKSSNGHQQQQQQQQQRDSLLVMPAGSQTLRRPTMSQDYHHGQFTSKTLQRVAQTNAAGQKSAIKVLLDNSVDSQGCSLDESAHLQSANKRASSKRRLDPISPSDHQAPVNRSSHLFNGLTTGLNVTPGAAQAPNSQPSFPQPNPGPEFEVAQRQDTTTICGLTPSVIDKHSRVVFPICFVCFNLMYWIIYGHISQQIEDKGPPLIPFIKG